MANLGFKAAAAIFLGHRELRAWALGLFGTALLLGVSLLLIWPGASSG